MIRFLRILCSISVLCVGSLTGCLLSAQGVPDRPVLRVAFSEFAPYTFAGPEGEAQGYAIDLITHIADRAGFDLAFVAAANPEEFLALLARGEVDMTPLLALTAERRAAGLATARLGQYQVSVYALAGGEITRIEALRGKRLGVVRGAIGSAVAEQIPQVQIVRYETSDDMLLPLLSGEIDAVVGVAETFEARLRDTSIRDKVRRVEPALIVIPYGLILRHGLDSAHAALDEVIAQAETGKMRTALRKKWFGSDHSILEHPWFANVAMIVGGLTWAAVALAIYAVRLRRRSVRLLAQNSENQLLVGALDKLRGAIVIFDYDMRAVHWNSGFEAQFASLVPALSGGATLEELCCFARGQKVMFSGVDHGMIATVAQEAAVQLRKGRTVQHLVRSFDGATFDLSLFSIGPRYFAAIWVDISELSRQRERIETQRTELMRKNEQLLAFSAMAAHDLKAPLFQQVALVEFILEDLQEAELVLPEGVQSHFDTLVDLSRRMTVLVRDLLTYAQADSARAAPERFAPDTRLASVLKLVPDATQITVEVAPGMPMVEVDPTSFDLVMRNLISNALKHHDRPAGKITVRAHRSGAAVLLEVEDDGPGIPQAERARVFEPFARLTRVEGTGLGLALVKKTVTSWGGTITLRGGAGRGAIFTVSMPAAAQDRVPLALPCTDAA